MSTPGKSVRFSVPHGQRYAVDNGEGSELGSDYADEEHEEEYEYDEAEHDDGPAYQADAPHVPVDLDSLPTGLLLRMAPHELREMFDTRVADLELEVEALKEKCESVEWGWQARYRELDVRCSVKDTEVAQVRKANGELREKISQYKRNLWMKSVDVEAIKLVEDEVQYALSGHEQDINDLRALHEEVVRAMQAYHDRNLAEFRTELQRQLTEAEEAIMQRVLLRSDPSATPLVHQALHDPLDILKALRRLHIGLYEKVYHADDKAKLPVILDRYRAKERELLNKHIGKTPREEGDEHRQSIEDALRAGAAERQDLARQTAALEQELSAAALQQQENQVKHAMARGLGDGDPEADAAAGDQLLEEKLTKAQNLCGALQAALVAHDAARTAEEALRMPDGTGDGIFTDKLFTEALQTSRFATRFEEVLRENERLKARLYLLEHGSAGSVGVGTLEDKKAQLAAEVDQLLARSERINLQCKTLEDQKHELKHLAQQAAKEADDAAALLPKERARRHRGSIQQAAAECSDSEDTASVSEEYSDDEDTFNPEEDLPMGQIAGVEQVVEEPEEEEMVKYEVEKKQFNATMRKEGHVASLIEQILQYLETGAPFYMLRHGQVIKFFAYLANNRSVINICNYHEGVPNRKSVSEIIMLRDVKQIILGQYSDFFKRLLKGSGGSNKVVDPNDLHLVPKDTEKVETYNTGTYFYRSFSLKMRGGRTINVIAHSDNDFETWMVAIHRITTIEPKYGKALDAVQFMTGYEDLLPQEREFCEQNHTPPLLYLNAKMQCLKQEYRLYLTLYDVRTLSGFDLLHSQKVFELWLAMTWCEKQRVYQVRYLEQYPHEASNLIATIDQQQQREAKREADRLLTENARQT